MRVDILHNLLLEGKGNSGPVTHIMGVATNLDLEWTMFVPKTEHISQGNRVYHTPEWAGAPTLVRHLLVNGSMAAAYVSFLRKRGRPAAIYSRGLLPVPALIALALRRPFIFELNGLRHVELLQESRSKLVATISKLLLHFSCRLATKIVVVTPGVKAALIAAGIQPQKISVFENGVDPKKFRPYEQAESRRKLCLLESDRYVGFVGALLPWQGVDDLVEAMAILAPKAPDAHLLIVGDGPEREALERLVQERNIGSRCTFVGHVQHDVVPYYIAAMDVCVMARIPSEASPLKLFEYWACAKATVATQVASLQNEQTNEIGVFVPPRAPDRLAGAILELLSDPIRAQKIGERARSHVLEHNTWQSVGLATAALIREAVVHPPDASPRAEG